MNDAIFFLVLSLFCVFLESFFSMFEMACVSLNKIRLQYYVSKNSKRAKWLQFLLKNPSYLFGTTLIGVNTVMQIGSESARRFYESIHLSADYAPISQIFLVLIFGELAPLFAARRHSEHVAFLTIPIIYFISRVLTPFIWVIGKISKVTNRLFGTTKGDFFLSKEELQKAFEERTQKVVEKDDINNIVSNIFCLKDKTASQIMLPIDSINLISSDSSLKEMMNILSVNYSAYIPIYHRFENNIVAMAYPKDLLKVDSDERVLTNSKPPWFITENTLVMEILKQFRHNNQIVAVILDKSGKSIGILSLDQIVDEIFGEYSHAHVEKVETKTFIERTLPGDMTIREFNTKFKANIKYEKAKTLSDLITALLGHHPSEGEIVHIDNFQMQVLEPSLLGAKLILVKTIV